MIVSGCTRLTPLLHLTCAAGRALSLRADEPRVAAVTGNCREPAGHLERPDSCLRPQPCKGPLFWPPHIVFKSSSPFQTPWAALLHHASDRLRSHASGDTACRCCALWQCCRISMTPSASRLRSFTSAPAQRLASRSICRASFQVQTCYCGPVACSSFNAACKL